MRRAPIIVLALLYGILMLAMGSWFAAATHVAMQSCELKFSANACHHNLKR